MGVTVNCPQLTLLDFGEREIETFVRQWAPAFERASAGGRETPETASKARTLERDLTASVKSNPGVRSLAANPLMLTMLALLCRQVGTLPDRRIKLYRSYMETLLESWIAQRSKGQRLEAIRTPNLDQTENVLMPLALRMHERSPGGCESEFLKGIFRKAGASTGATSEREEEYARQAENFLHDMHSLRGHDAYAEPLRRVQHPSELRSDAQLFK